MKIVNETSFKLLTQGGQNSASKSLVVIVKGTFDLQPEAACTVADEQAEFAADTPHVDELGRSLAWASDLVPFKPHTDFHVHGTCYQPNGVAAPSGIASIRLGPLRKDIAFHGPRQAWQRRDGTWEVGAATPVISVPLRWEYALGGLRDAANPMGRGRDAEAAQDGTPRIALPLLEYPDRPWTAPDDRSPPANFAPVPLSFGERRRKNGTRDQRWATFRAPLPPLDYDISINNAAPADQQFGNYPRGDEWMLLGNLHPAHPVLRTQLPGLRLRVGLLRQKQDGITAQELVMNLDTVVACPNANKLVLTWRHRAEAAAAEAGEPIWLQCFAERLDAAPAPLQPLAEGWMRQYVKALPPGPAAYDRAIAKGMAEIRAKAAKAKLPPALAKAFQTESDPQRLLEGLHDHMRQLTAELQQITAKGKAP